MTDDEIKSHRRFTVSDTSYLGNLDREDLRARCVAVHHQNPPTKTDQGTSIGLRYPMLIMAHYIDDPDGVAARVAEVLEAHWDEAPATPGASDFIRKVREVAEKVGHLAGVGAMETAGAVVSFLAAHPDKLDTFMSNGLMDFPSRWLEKGCLTWHAQNRTIVHPDELRAAGEGDDEHR